jgi:transaldolase
MSAARQLQQAGVSIWLDTLSRDLLESGNFERYVRDYGVSGATSNPTIFERAIAGSASYDGQLRSRSRSSSARMAFFDLALADVVEAAELLRPVYEASRGRDGYVSFQTTPDLSHDSAGMIDQALALWRRLDLPNVMIKVPATSSGVAATQELTVLGVNVNVTLLFSVERYGHVIEAYFRGLDRRLAKGLPLGGIASVASFFVSRMDAKVDPGLPEGSPLRGKVAIATARRAYALQQGRFGGERWARLEAAGARPQRPLWASTGTKDPSYSDVLYVEELATPGAVNTMPEATLRAFADHGKVHVAEGDGYERVLAEGAAAGVELDRVAAELEREGIESFQSSYERLMEEIESRTATVAA